MSKRKPLEQRISELEARKQTLVAKQRKQKRTRDTRRKILLGALVLKSLGEDSHRSANLRNWLREDLPVYLTRKSDLELFDDLLENTNNYVDGPQSN